MLYTHREAQYISRAQDWPPGNLLLHQYSVKGTQPPLIPSRIQSLPVTLQEIWPLATTQNRR
jgi:hypothetical protein